MKKNKILLTASILTASVFSWNCGAWDQAKSQAVVQKCTELKDSTTVDNPEQQRQLDALFDECTNRAMEGKLGIMDVATFEVQLTAAVQDGIVDETEMNLLRQTLTSAAE